MTPLTSAEGQSNLPRFFTQVFAQASSIENGRLDIALPDGRLFRAQGAGAGPVAHVDVHNADLFARLVRDGDVGFAEAYMDGWWSSPDLQAFMDLVHTRNDAMLHGFPGLTIVRAFERLRFWMQRNSKTQAPRNIQRHYDLGNEFYAQWLDETMTYSSALFHSGQESLDTAQIAKYAAMVDQMEAHPGEHVLEIGCGWGGFAEYAASKRGLRVTGLTLSRAQHDYATRRIANAGLADRVDIKLQDYRDERGIYDGIASIEMFEAVGERYWPTYFDTVRTRLKPGRHAALQIITVQDQRFQQYRSKVDFIQKYVFPGGMLPSPGALRREAEKAGLSMLRSMEFGDSYSQTLRRWHDSFAAKWDVIAHMGFDERFRRMWEYYLTSCAASFATGICNVTQVTLRSPGR